MGTRARVKLINDGEVISSTYYPMDGHVENWSAQLVVALQHTTPKKILDNRSLFKFMFNDYYGEDDDFLDHLCEIEILENEYHFKVYGFKKRLDFEGTLDEFSRKYC